MKKILMFLIMALLFKGNCLAAGVTYEFSADQVANIIEGTCYIYLNVETIDDPEWVDPGEGNPGHGDPVPQVPKYTDSQWTKEVYRRIIIRDTRRGLRKKAKDTIVDVNVPDDSVTAQ